jgi:hypothetical protein
MGGKNGSCKMPRISSLKNPGIKSGGYLKMPQDPDSIEFFSFQALLN